MFIRVKTNHEGNTNEFDLNTNQICYIDGIHVQMSNGFTVYLTDESLKEVQETIYGSTEEVNPQVAEKTANLLNELYKLCGSQGDVKVTSDRKARLKTRLKDFTPDELKLAAKNLGANEWMQGQNDSGKRYGTLDYLLKTSANVNKCLEDQPEEKKKKMF